MQKYIDNNQWVDWFDLASQTGITNSYNLSTSYSNDRVTSYFSLGYYNLEGLLKGDELERYSARAKIDFKANEMVKYGLNLYAMYSEMTSVTAVYGTVFSVCRHWVLLMMKTAIW